MFDIIFVAFISLLSLGLMASNRYSSDLVLVTAVAILILFNVLKPEEALAGFTNPGLVTIAVLYVVVAGLQATGAVSWLSQFLLGVPKKLSWALLRILVAAMSLSAFVNNSPVVAIFTSSIQTWAKRTQYQASQLLMPLSYAAILGGTCTLIGTSTNLVVDGLAKQSGIDGFGLFDLAYIGIPICLIGLVYLLIFPKFLLPNRQSAEDRFENTREYMVQMRVESASELVNRSIEEAGLRHLPGLFLIEINRGSEVLSAVAPSTRIQAEDKLVFVGAVESVVELRNIRGLVVDDDQSFKVHGQKSERRLFEAVVAAENPIVSKSIRVSRFRHRYNAAVLAVARNGQRISGKVGDIVIQPGDILLLEAQKGFLFKYRYSRDFLLINRLESESVGAYEKAPVAAAIVVAMVLLNISGLFSILNSVLLAAGAMLLTGCINTETARKSVDYRLLLTIAMAFGLGMAIQKTGLAEIVVGGLRLYSDDNPWLLLTMIYVITVLLTEVVTNNAAAIVMFPVALGAAESGGLSPYPFLVAVMIAASASFLTPIGYQTNLMVQGPGGYRFTDYIKLGLPLSLLVGITATLLIPMVWPFS